MNDSASKDEELDLHVKKALRYVFESVLNRLLIADGSMPLASVRTSHDTLHSVNGDDDEGTNKQEKDTWKQLRQALRIILHELTVLRMRMDVDPRDFQVFWPDAISRIKLPSEEVMGNGDDWFEGEWGVKAVMFPGVMVRGEDGKWTVVYKAAACLAPVG